MIPDKIFVVFWRKQSTPSFLEKIGHCDLQTQDDLIWINTVGVRSVVKMYEVLMRERLKDAPYHYNPNDLKFASAEQFEKMHSVHNKRQVTYR